MMPEIEEVKHVFSLKGESTCGPNHLSVTFYQICWDIVGQDVIELVKAIFERNTLPRSITHSNPILLPKKANRQNLVDLRPISLCNFTNKFISRVFHDRLKKLLPKLIPCSQSDFVNRNALQKIFSSHRRSLLILGQRVN